MTGIENQRIDHRALAFPRRPGDQYMAGGVTSDALPKQAKKRLKGMGLQTPQSGRTHTVTSEIKMVASIRNMVQLLSPWPERDPCIITSVFLLLIACYTAWRPRAKELAMPLLVAGSPRPSSRRPTAGGAPNIALFYADLFCAIFLLHGPPACVSRYAGTPSRSSQVGCCTSTRSPNGRALSACCHDVGTRCRALPHQVTCARRGLPLA